MKRILIAAAFLLTPFVALGHGDAAWIQAAHPACCGIRDCQRIGEVSLRGGVYSFAHPTRPGVVVQVPESQMKPSQDGGDWACFYEEAGALSPHIRAGCLFLAERV